MTAIDYKLTSKTQVLGRTVIQATQVKKYSGKSINQLIKIADVHFKRFIRERDEGKPCISCGSFSTLQAGHFYSAGHYPELRYNELNVHGQCLKCNMFLSGNLNEYRKRLPERIGLDKLNNLDLIVGITKNYKWDRFNLIDIILRYK